MPELYVIRIRRYNWLRRNNFIKNGLGRDRIRCNKEGIILHPEQVFGFEEKTFAKIYKWFRYYFWVLIKAFESQVAKYPVGWYPG